MKNFDNHSKLCLERKGANASRTFSLLLKFQLLFLQTYNFHFHILCIFITFEISFSCFFFKKFFCDVFQLTQPQNWMPGPGQTIQYWRKNTASKNSDRKGNKPQIVCQGREMGRAMTTKVERWNVGFCGEKCLLWFWRRQRGLLWVGGIVRFSIEKKNANKPPNTLRTRSPFVSMTRLMMMWLMFWNWKKSKDLTWEKKYLQIKPQF